MRVKPSLLIYLSLLAGIWRFTDGFEPVTTAFSLTAVTIAGVSLFGKPLYCVMKECCDERWIKDQLPNLRRNLTTDVYGQHLAINAVVKSLEGNLRSRSQQPLVLSFHGSAGVGKSYVARILAKNMYAKGMDSNYVHMFRAKDLPNMSVADLKEWLHKYIVKHMKGCDRQLFIFDEVDKMPDGVLGVLEQYMESYDRTQHFDYRNAVFIFLSNAGGEALYQKTYNHHLSGKNRQDLKLVHVAEILEKEANAKGGLKGSALISSGAISHYIPFLPLERDHVRMCIEYELARRVHKGWPASIVNEIMEEVIIKQPDDVYSTYGCRGIDEKTNLVIED